MARYVEQSFVGAEMDIDGEVFERCTFDRCVLIYRGGEMPTVLDCTLNSSRFKLLDAAARTVEFMTHLYHGMGPGGQRLIEETFNQIRRPGGPASKGN